MMEAQLTVEEVAKVLRVSTRHVYDLVSRGKIPYLKFSKRVVFRPSSIQAWLEAQEKGVTRGRKTA